MRVAVETSEHAIFFQNATFDMLAWLRKNSASDSAWRPARVFPVARPFTTEQHTYQVYAAPPDKLGSKTSTELNEFNNLDH